MATQTGECGITKIDIETYDNGEVNWIVNGWIRSLHNGKVGGGDTLAAMILWDALEQSGSSPVTEAELRKAIVYCEFAQENAERSDFFITVGKPDLIAGLKPMEWESYYVG